MNRRKGRGKDRRDKGKREGQEGEEQAGFRKAR